MRVLVLPKTANNQLLRELSRFQQTSDYQTFCQRLSISLRSTKLQSPDNSKTLVLLINRILLTNICRYIEDGADSRFLHCIAHKHIGSDMYVNNHYVCDFVKEMLGNGVPEYEHTSIENFICKEIASFINFVYTQASDRFNEVFLALYEMLHRYIPYPVFNVRRFELSPELDPIVFCTPKQTYNTSVNTHESICTQ